jgi:hypothetical protein
MSLPAIVDGIVRVLTAGEVRATSHPGEVNAPCVVVGFWEEMDLRETFRDARRYVIPLQVIISLTDARAARAQAEETAEAIAALIEGDPTLDGSCDSAAPTIVTPPSIQELAGAEYLTFDVRVEVWA